MSNSGDLFHSSQSPSLTILGRGAWGSTLAALAQANHVSLNQWSRRDATELIDAVQGSKIIVSAISMKGVPSVIQQLQGNLPSSTIIVSATKGLDAATLKSPLDLWQEAFPDSSTVVLSGPNLSKEIDAGLPAATVVSSHSEAAAITVQQVFASDRFRVYTNTDPVGTELGGTLKNIMAIAAGVCDGLELGSNAKSALIARGLAEMVRIGVRMGAKTETFSGLSGLGDLLATCSSLLSRNYRVGYYLARQQTLAEILKSLGGTAEGVSTTPVMVELAKRDGIPIPITVEVDRLLRQETTPAAAVTALMDRALTAEMLKDSNCDVDLPCTRDVADKSSRMSKRSGFQ